MQKKVPKIWSIQKKAVLLHPLFASKGGKSRSRIVLSLRSREAQVAELVDALVSNTNGKPCRFDPGPGYYERRCMQ